MLTVLCSKFCPEFTGLCEDLCQRYLLIVKGTHKFEYTSLCCLIKPINPLDKFLSNRCHKMLPSFSHRSYHIISRSRG